MIVSSSIILPKYILGAFSELMNMHQLQVQSAQRENTFFEQGVMPEIKEYDDNTIHIEEHTRYILQMRFQLFKVKKPEYASIIEQHLKQHKDLEDFEQQQNAMSKMLPEQMQQGGQ